MIEEKAGNQLLAWSSVDTNKICIGAPESESLYATFDGALLKSQPKGISDLL